MGYHQFYTINILKLLSSLFIVIFALRISISFCRFKKYLLFTLEYRAKRRDLSTVILRLSFNISCMRDDNTFISFACS